jgi:hypothetical protein
MSAIGEEDHGAPIFKAVSSSARQLFQLLNCIRFASKAQVQISNEGLRFAVEESRVMQGRLNWTTELVNVITSQVSSFWTKLSSLPSIVLLLSRILLTMTLTLSHPTFQTSQYLSRLSSKPSKSLVPLISPPLDSQSPMAMLMAATSARGVPTRSVTKPLVWQECVDYPTLALGRLSVLFLKSQG